MTVGEALGRCGPTPPWPPRQRIASCIFLQHSIRGELERTPLVPAAASCSCGSWGVRPYRSGRRRPGAGCDMEPEQGAAMDCAPNDKTGEAGRGGLTLYGPKRGGPAWAPRPAQ